MAEWYTRVLIKVTVDGCLVCAESVNDHELKRVERLTRSRKESDNKFGKLIGKH